MVVVTDSGESVGWSGMVSGKCDARRLAASIDSHKPRALRSAAAVLYLLLAHTHRHYRRTHTNTARGTRFVWLRAGCV